MKIPPSSPRSPSRHILKRFAAVAALVCFLPLVQAQTDLDTLKQRLLAYRIPLFTTSAWEAEPSNLAFLLAEQETDGRWTDITYTDQSQAGGGWKPLTHLRRLEAMAASTRRSGSPYATSPNREVMVDAVLRGLDYWLNGDFECTDNNYIMAILRNLSLKSITVLMEEHLNDTQKQKILTSLYSYITFSNGVWSYHYPTIGTAATGQNRLWLADIHLHGALLKNSAAEATAAASAIRSLSAVTSGEGINLDYSFMQHGNQLNSGAYGSFFAQDMARNIRLFQGLSYAFNESQIAPVRNYVLKGHQWMLRRNHWDTHVIGRQLAEINETIAHPLNKQTLLDLKLGDPGTATTYQNMLDHMNGLNDGILTGNSHFYRADYTAHRRAGYSFHTRMSSTRTMITETGNNENIQNSYLAQGSNSILLVGDEYTSIFPCWRWDRIPGVTAPEKNPAPRTANWGVPGTKTFVGGVSNGIYGASAKDLSWDGVSGKKSWFYFDDDIVCLGAGITYTGNRNVFTTLNQTIRKSTPVSASSTGALTTHTAPANVTLANPKWVYQGNVGYVFPSNQSVVLKSDSNLQGDWFNINQNTYTDNSNLETKNVFTLMIAHGLNAVTTSYAYIVLPAQTQTFVQTYSATPQSRVIVNNTSIQAVRNDVKKVASIIFWAAGEVILSSQLKVIVDKPCMVIVDESNPTTRVSVASYQADTVSLTLDYTPGADTVLSFVLPGGTSAGSTVTKTVSTENNLALGRNVTFSEQQTNNEAAKAVDGVEVDDINRWSAQGYPEWIEVDLGANRTFTRTRVCGASNRAYRFRVQTKVDGGTSYTTVHDATSNTAATPLTQTFTSQNARYVRLTVTGAYNYSGGWTSIREFKVLP